MIKLQAKIFELNFLSKFSDLKSNFTLTLGYLNPALNNWGQIIPDPVSNSNISYQYCLITTTQVINDAKDSLENCFLEFQKLNSEVKRVPLHKIANLQEALRTRKLVFIPIKPSSRSQEKESIFTYRPFKVTNVNQSTSNDLLCVFVKDKDKSFDVIDLEIQRRIEQTSHMINFQVIEDLGVKPLTTHSELTRIANCKPDGGVILERRENQDNKFIAVGCLDFADDGSICPVFFPLSPTGMFNIRSSIRSSHSLSYL